MASTQQGIMQLTTLYNNNQIQFDATLLANHHISEAASQYEAHDSHMTLFQLLARSSDGLDLLRTSIKKEHISFEELGQSINLIQILKPRCALSGTAEGTSPLYWVLNSLDYFNKKHANHSKYLLYYSLTIQDYYQK